MSKRKTLLLGVGTAAVLAAVAGAFLPRAFETSVVGQDVEQPLSAEDMQKLAERGQYVAAVADCYACHTAKDGPPWAGGMPLPTPFGTIYSTNISPDKEHGIGNWTRADFHHALRDGIGKGGKHLYPAMPYTSYREMTPQDVDAVYAYLMTREPMPVANHKNGLVFPFNIRALLASWDLMNLRRDGFSEDPSRSATWNRGRYIVDALAHCGECHTPRTSLQAMNEKDYLKGSVINGVEAPDITKEGLTRMGFDPQTLAQFMKTGLSAQGSMTHDMFEVVHFSTQYMNKADIDALSAYLFDLDEVPEHEAQPVTPAPVEVSANIAADASNTYANLCAGCHGADGQGIPHVAVPLATNASLRLATPRNFLQAVLHGIPAQHFPGLERMEPMPAFGDLLGDQKLTDLANWARARWGGQEPNVTTEDVKQLR